MKSLFFSAMIASSAMLLTMVLTLSSCGGGSNTQLNQDQSASDTTASAPAMADFAIDMSPANIAAGHATYRTTCTPCHGESGKGDGPAAAALNPKPQDHTNGAYMNKLTNAHIFQTIKGGGAQFGKPGMPAQPQLANDTIKNLIAFVRSLAQNPPYTPTK